MAQQRKEKPPTNRAARPPSYQGVMRALRDRGLLEGVMAALAAHHATVPAVFGRTRGKLSRSKSAWAARHAALAWMMTQGLSSVEVGAITGVDSSVARVARREAH